MSDLTDFLLARIAEDEERADRVEFHPYVGDGIPSPLTARVLAECEAKRQIVGYCPSASKDGDAWDTAFWRVLQLLTLPYAAHPDYQPEWRP